MALMTDLPNVHDFAEMDPHGVPWIPSHQGSLGTAQGLAAQGVS